MILNCIDDRWDKYLMQMPFDQQDVYYTSQYYQIEQVHQNGIGQIFVYKDKSGNIGMYPFVKRPIINKELGNDYYDIETAYGYGGPIIKKSDISFESKFEDAFLQYCKRENIVAEFVRFHPLLKNEHIFKHNMQVIHNRITVWINLELDLEDIWMNQISTQNRNIIRKCKKNGLYVELGKDYDEFIKIYNETMDKVHAEKFYYFSDSCYNHMKSHKEYVLLYVKKEENILAGAIFMCHGEYFHYHLSGSKKEFLKLAPNNILLWEAIKYAKEHGYKKMHFGGGLTDSLEDSLFCFKRKFSSTTSDFYIGKRIHDKKIYDMLIKKWENEHQQKAKLLLQYRE